MTDLDDQLHIKPELRIARALERIAGALEPLGKLAIEAIEEDRERTVPAREVTRIPPPRVNRPRQ